MVMADVTVITDLMHEEEKRIKTFLEGLGQKLKDKGVSEGIPGGIRAAVEGQGDTRMHSWRD